MKNFYHHLLFEEYQFSVEALSLYRILFASIYLLFVGVPSFSWVAEVPEYFFFPQKFSIARPLFSEIPPEAFLVVLDISILITLLLILFGYKTTFSCLAFTVLLLIGYSLKFALGKIGHSILLVVLPALLAFSGWGRRLSLDAKRKQVSDASPSGYSPFMVALVLGFAMFTAGWSKVLGGWLSPNEYGTFYFYSLHYYVLDDKGWLSPLFENISTPFIWKSMDYAALALELLFLPAILKKKWLQTLCVVAVVFHFFTLWILNIAFINNLLVYLLFIPWHRIVLFFERKQLFVKLQQLITWRSFGIVSSLFLLQHLFFLTLQKEYLVSNQLVSPLSFIAISSEWDFRQLRVIPLFIIAFLFVVVSLFLSRSTWKPDAR